MAEYTSSDGSDSNGAGAAAEYDNDTAPINSEFVSSINERIKEIKSKHPDWIDPVAEKNAAQLEKTWKNILNNHDIGMAFNLSDLEDIERTGFKSFLENKKTNSSMGGTVMSKEGYAEYVAWAKRTGKEPKPYSEFLNRPVEHLTKVRTAHENLIYGKVVNEKYGALIDKNLKSIKDSGLGNYGNIVVKFKDKVRERATWTMNDSLNYNTSSKRTPMIPSPVSAPSVASMGLQYKSSKGSRVYPKAGDEHLSMKDLTSKLKTSYVEVQLHGKLTASDIDRIYIRKKDYNNLSNSMRKKYNFVIVTG